MKRVFEMGILLSIMAGVALSASAAEMKKALVLNYPGDPMRQTMAEHALKGLESAGFKAGSNLAVTVAQPQSVQDAVKLTRDLTPDIVIDVGVRHRLIEALSEVSAVPILIPHDVEKFVDAESMPTANVNGVYTSQHDLIYHSFKFLQKVAPLKPGQQAVFLRNLNIELVPQPAVEDALRRLNIPLKAVADMTVYEDWQEAVLKYNDDPDVGWIIESVWPTIKRDGSPVDMERDCAPWQREHLKKPYVTYWEIAVQWGVLCAFGVDLNDVAMQCGEMAARVLKGEDITSIKADYPRKTLVVLNRKTADTIGLVFPLDVLNLANVIYHDWEGKEVSRKSGLK